MKELLIWRQNIKCFCTAQNAINNIKRQKLNKKNIFSTYAWPKIYNFNRRKLTLGNKIKKGHIQRK